MQNDQVMQHLQVVIVTRARGLLAALVTATVAAAQMPVDRAGAEILRTFPAISRSCAVGTGEGTAWAVGPHYRLLCEPQGVTFTPALGRAVSHSYPVHLALESIQRGGRPIVSSTVAAASPRLVGSTVEYARAPAITERYAVTPEGVELSFRFEAPLPGTGDLVVRMRVRTELQAKTEPGCGGARWTVDDLGGVRIGSVLAIDAAGRRSPGMLRCDGSYLELAIPGAVMAEAAFPLVLDPLLSAEVPVATADCGNADVAYDSPSGTYLVAFEKVYSATDTDIWAQRVSDLGTMIGGVIQVARGSNPEVNPTVGHVRNSRQFLVCWQNGASVFGPWDIEAACVDALSGVVSAAATIAGTSADETDPDAACESNSTASEALVVWRAGSSASSIMVSAVTIPVAGAPVVSSTQQVSSGGSLSLDAPAISQFGGTSRRHLVVWKATSPSSGRIEAVCVGPGGVPLTAVHTVAAPTHAPDQPDVDGDGTNFLVAWQQFEARGGRRDIYAQSIAYGAVRSTLSNVGNAKAIEADAMRDEMAPAVAALGVKYVVLWADEVGTLDYEVAGIGIDASNCVVCSRRFVLGAGGKPLDTEPAIGSQRASGVTGTPANGDESLIAFTAADNTPPYAAEVRAAAFEAIGLGGGGFPASGRCGSVSMTASPSGVFAIGNPSFSFTLSATPGQTAGSVAGFIMGAAAPPIACGSCQITPPSLVIAHAPSASGTYTQSLAIPCQAGLLGSAFDLQWLITPTTSGCGPYSMSERWRLVVGE